MLSRFFRAGASIIILIIGIVQPKDYIFRRIIGETTPQFFWATGMLFYQINA
jgi:hypothetical protein